MDKDTDLMRRRWLELTSAGLVTLGFSACGGGGSGDEADGAAPVPGPAPAPGPAPTVPPAPAPAPPPAGALSDTQRAAALSSIEASVNRLMAGAKRFDSTLLAAELAAMPSIRKSGVDSSNQSVWATFVDGRRLVIPNDLHAPAAAAGASRAGRSGVVSKPSRAVKASLRATAVKPFVDGVPAEFDSLLTGNVFHSFVSLAVEETTTVLGFTDDYLTATSDGEIDRMALALGFEYSANSSGSSLLSDLHGENIGVLTMSAISATYGDPEQGRPCTMVASSTRANAALTTQEAAALASHELCYMVAPPGLSPSQPWRTVIGFTSAYAVKQWDFNSRNMLLLNFTGGRPTDDWLSLSDDSNGQVQTLLFWTRPLDIAAVLRARIDMLRLMFATNQFQGFYAVAVQREPRFRNYGIAETAEYLHDRGVFGESEIEIHRHRYEAPYIVTTIRPTIDWMLVKEVDPVLEMVGQFGADDDGKVRIVNTLSNPTDPGLLDSDPIWSDAGRVKIVEWRGGSITVELNDVPKGGYVQVFNGKRWSNAAQLTYWEIPFTYRLTIDGGLSLTATIKAGFRCDIRGYRLTPAQRIRDNDANTYSMSSTRATSLAFEAAGTLTNEVRINSDTVETTTINWSGGAAGSDLLNIDCTVRSSDFKAMVVFGSIANVRYRQVTKVVRKHDDGRTETIKDESISVPFTILLPPIQELSFNGERHSVQRGEVSATQSIATDAGPRSMTLSLNWSDAESQFPPEPKVGGV